METTNKDNLACFKKEEFGIFYSNFKCHRSDENNVFQQFSAEWEYVTSYNIASLFTLFHFATTSTRLNSTFGVLNKQTEMTNFKINGHNSA